MSYILEALRKAEQERSLGQVPNWETLYAAPAPPRRRIWPGLLLVTALLANAAVLAVLLIPRSEDPSRTAAVPVAAVTPAAPTVVLVQPPPVRALSEESAAEPTALEPGLSTPPPPPKPAAIPRPKPAGQVIRAPVAMLPAEPPPDLEEVQSVLPEPLSSRQTPAEADPAAAALNLDIHIYSEDRRRRFVVINSKRYREGESLSEGPLLEAITTDGAVLVGRQGRRFLLPVHR